MNVMAKAHKATKAKIASLKANSLKAAPYAAIFKAQLRHAHQEYKKMQKSLTVDQMFAIQHFEDCIARTLVHFEKLGVNDYYIAIENNSQINDYTILAHKDANDVNSPLGWASYANAIVTHHAQAVQYEIAFPGVVKLHAQTYLSKVLESFRESVANISK